MDRFLENWLDLNTLAWDRRSALIPSRRSAAEALRHRIRRIAAGFGGPRPQAGAAHSTTPRHGR